MSHPYKDKMQGGKIAQKRYGKADGGSAGMDRAKNYMRGMKVLAAGTSKSAGQYGAENAQKEYDYARKLTGMDKE